MDVRLLESNPFSLGVETCGGMMTKVIPRHNRIPNKRIVNLFWKPWDNSLEDRVEPRG